MYVSLCPVQNLCALDVAYSGLLTDGAMRSLTAMTALSSLNFARCGKVRRFPFTRPSMFQFTSLYSFVVLREEFLFEKHGFERLRACLPARLLAHHLLQGAKQHGFQSCRRSVKCSPLRVFVPCYESSLDAVPSVRCSSQGAASQRCGSCHASPPFTSCGATTSASSPSSRRALMCLRGLRACDHSAVRQTRARSEMHLCAVG